MTPQKRTPEQSPDLSLKSHPGSDSLQPKPASTRVDSQMFLDYIIREVPVHPIDDFLDSEESPESIQHFLKRTAAFRIQLRRGESAYCESPDTRSLIYVERGRVLLSIARGGIRSISKQAGPGLLFGESPLLEMHTFGAEAVAMEEAIVFLIDSSAVESEILNLPVLARRWLTQTASVASRASLEARMLLFGVVENRLAALLIEMSRGSHVLSSITQTEIARRLGIYRETLSIALRSLKKQRLVKVKRRRIEIVNRPNLEAMVAPFTEGGRFEDPWARRSE